MVIVRPFSPSLAELEEREAVEVLAPELIEGVYISACALLVLSVIFSPGIS